MLVLRTLIAAGLANLSAELAKLLGEVAAARHVGCCHPANGCAVNVQRDASGHHLHVLFLKARGRAVVAGVGADIARLDASLIGLMSHDNLLVHKGQSARSSRTAEGVADQVTT